MIGRLAVVLVRGTLAALWFHEARLRLTNEQREATL